MNFSAIKQQSIATIYQDLRKGMLAKTLVHTVQQVEESEAVVHVRETRERCWWQIRMALRFFDEMERDLDHLWASRINSSG